MMMTSESAELDGWIDAFGHHYLLRVQYEDTDLGGIVYHANYLKFAERARSACLRLCGVFQENLITADGGHAFVVRRAEIDFAKSAGLGAVLCVTSRVVKSSRLTVKMEQTIKNQETGHILAGVVVDIVYVRIDGVGQASPVRMPASLLDKLLAGQG
ncbi:MAG: YbgC/FadM family acyl-CoA thioesterase [Alphaproteobacteria bacterium]